MKKHFIFVLVLLCGTIIGVLLILSSSLLFQNSSPLKNYFKGEKTTALLPSVSSQEEINKHLTEISESNQYTLENPYIEINPYKISPLSAIIIFSTDDEEVINVRINNQDVTSLDSTRKHIIPIYGLYEDYNNTVLLTTSHDEKEITIKTDKSDIPYPLIPVYASETINEETIYFTVSSYKTWLTGWDKLGNLRFYLTIDNRMDVEWLDNGHFLIGTTEGEFAENFIGFVEIDYLGKIYNYYTLEHGSSFEIQVLKNGNIMTAGGKKPVYIDEQVVYEIDALTGKTLSSINLYEMFKEIDANFPSKYLGQAAIRNGFYYNEENGEMVISFRGINTVFGIDYNQKKLKWIFTEPTNELFKNDVWEQYKVISESGSYPKGQHAPIITKEGYIAFFNNGYDRYHGFEVGGNDLVTSYKENYSRAEIFKIENKKATLIWQYDESKKLFSHQYGSITIDDAHNKLINFGYVLKDDYRNDKKATLSASEANPNNIYSYIIELDAYNNIIFKATCEEGKYRVFKGQFYNRKTNNVKLDELNIINTIPDDDLELTNYLNVDLSEASEWINTIEFTKNVFKTDYAFTTDDEIKLYFLDKVGRIYILNYKDKNSAQINRIFNLNLYSGDYQLFISVNDTLYNTNKVYTF